jgi:hypothetical protein
VAEKARKLADFRAQSEKLAELAAGELMYPREFREDDIKSIADGRTDPQSVSDAFPYSAIHHRRSPSSEPRAYRKSRLGVGKRGEGYRAGKTGLWRQDEKARSRRVTTRTTSHNSVLSVG